MVPARFLALFEVDECKTLRACSPHWRSSSPARCTNHPTARRPAARAARDKGAAQVTSAWAERAAVERAPMTRVTIRREREERTTPGRKAAREDRGASMRRT